MARRYAAEAAAMIIMMMSLRCAAHLNKVVGPGCGPTTLSAKFINLVRSVMSILHAPGFCLNFPFVLYRDRALMIGPVPVSDRSRANAMQFSRDVGISPDLTPVFSLFCCCCCCFWFFVQ